MAQVNPRLPALDTVTADPANGYTIHGFMSAAAALPNGATYAGIFAPFATLQIETGAAAGLYVNTGSAAVPAFSEVAVEA